MAPINESALTDFLTQGPNRVLVGGKQLTLAFGGLYIATTTASYPPLMVWEPGTVYARYYVPNESLHASIRAHLGEAAANGETNGHSSSEVSTKIEATGSLKGKGTDAEAVIERLIVGSRTATWVRFTGGLLKGYVRFERDEIDDWFEDGAIFAGIKNPYKRIDTKPVTRNIVVKVDGEVVAETQTAVVLHETGLKDAYYLPATSIKSWGAISKSDLRTACPYKGEAWYLNLTVKGKKHDNAIWYYMYPTHESSGVEGFISFYNRENVDILVDGVKYGEEKDVKGVTVGPASFVPANKQLVF